GGIEVADGFREICAIDVRHKTKCHCSVCVVLESLVRHYRTEVRAADANVDHVPNPFAGVTFPLAASHSVGKIGHLVEYSMHFGHDILAVHDDRSVARCAQGGVQDSTLLREVDLISPKHGVDSFLQLRLLGELDQQPEGFARDAILRVVQKKANSLGGHALAAFRIFCKELPQM